MKDSTKNTIKYAIITIVVIGILIILKFLFENDMRRESCKLLETDQSFYENFDAGFDNEIFASEVYFNKLFHDETVHNGFHNGFHIRPPKRHVRLNDFGGVMYVNDKPPCRRGEYSCSPVPCPAVYQDDVVCWKCKDVVAYPELE